MIELFEKSVMTMLGAATLTQQKTEELLKELREKMNVTEEEGKEFLQKLQSMANENQSKMQEQARQEVKKACERMGVVTVDEFEKQTKKIARLEKQIVKLETQVVKLETQVAAKPEQQDK